jgi:integrase
MKGCRPLAEDEVDVVRKSFSGIYATRDKALFILGVKSGFRISELLSLRVGDVWQHGRLVDRVTVARAHMKKKVEGRTVVLHPEAKAALTAWLDVRKADGALLPSMALFPSREGVNRPISCVQAWRILEARPIRRTSSPGSWGRTRCARRSPTASTRSSSMTW